MRPDEVRAIRDSLGFTQAQMAELMLLSAPNGRDTIRAWEASPESARHRPVPGPATLALMALRDGWRPK